jgi:hypothetical protein
MHMAWAVFAVLMTFYLLGVFEFHAPATIHILPFVAVGVIILDYLIVKRFRKS